MDQYKTCSRCKQSLNCQLFSYRKAAKDKLTSWCKPCMAENARNRRLENLEKSRASSRAYYQLNKVAIQRNLAQWRRRNKDYLTTYQQEWRSKNTDKVRLYSRVHGSIRRARERAVDNFEITSRDIRRLLNQKCVYCGNSSTQIDHVIPLSRGGTNGIGNLASACTKCNASKNNRFVMEWRLDRKRPISG